MINKISYLSLLYLFFLTSCHFYNDKEISNHHKLFQIKSSQCPKPSQKIDFFKYPLNSISYYNVLKESEKTRERLIETTYRIVAHYKNSKVFIPSLKKFKRAKEKIDTDYKGDWRKLTDVVRGSLSFETVDDLLSALTEFGTHFPIIYIKNKFLHPKDGYRDINILFRDQVNNLIGEMQFHLCHIFNINKSLHKQYRIIRKIESEVIKKNRDLSPEEKKKIEQARQRRLSAYEEAYFKILRKENCPN